LKGGPIRSKLANKRCLDAWIGLLTVAIIVITSSLATSRNAFTVPSFRPDATRIQTILTDECATVGLVISDNVNVVIVREIILRITSIAGAPNETLWFPTVGTINPLSPGSPEACGLIAAGTRSHHTSLAASFGNAIACFMVDGIPFQVVAIRKTIRIVRHVATGIASTYQDTAELFRTLLAVRVIIGVAQCRTIPHISYSEPLVW